MLTTSLTMLTHEKKRAPSGVAECPSGRSGTAEPPRDGKPPVESGPAASTLDPRADTEPGRPVLTKREAESPERGRAG